MEVKGIMDAGMELFQSLIPKSCKIKYPNTTINSLYKNKEFLISTVQAGKLSEKYTKSSDYSFSEEYIRVSILYSTLEETSIGTTLIKTYGFKDDNVTITYKKNKYIVVEENICEFEAGIELICKRTT